MLVAWSATRSRKRETRMSRMARGMVLGSSIMNVRSSRKICSFRASTASSSPHTWRASWVSRATNASRLSLTIRWALSAIRGRPMYGFSWGFACDSSHPLAAPPGTPPHTPAAAPLDPPLGALGHPREVDVRLELGLAVQLDHPLGDVDRLGADPLEIRDELHGGGGG